MEKTLSSQAGDVHVWEWGKKGGRTEGKLWMTQRVAVDQLVAGGGCAPPLLASGRRSVVCVTSCRGIETREAVIRVEQHILELLKLKSRPEVTGAKESVW